MAKIMLVEDDNNLREIYQARLLAEGYEIVAAKDGEEALAMAVKEKPDLIIADIMMPKISGFDMLDILRSTPETKDTKVIVMTALSQAEDKARADKLGADRYLVKSQVTLEDVAKAAKEVLAGEKPTVGSTTATIAPAPDPAATPATPIANPVEPPDVAATTTDIPVKDAPTPLTPIANSDEGEPIKQEKAEVAAEIKQFADNNDKPAAQVSNPPATATPKTNPTQEIKAAESSNTSPKTQDDIDAPSTHKKVIEPLNDPTKKPDLDALLAKEEAKEGANPTNNPAPEQTSPNPETPAAPLQETASSEPEPEPHKPGEVFGPQTPGSDPSDPNAVSL